MAPPLSSSPTDPLTSLTEQTPMSDSLRALARRGVLRRVRKGQHLISEGDYGDTLYIVLAGRLRAYATSADDRELTYGEYGAGEYVGEMGLDGGPRSAHVAVVSAGAVAVVTRATLEQHLASDPAFAFELLAKVIRRARAATLSLKRIALNRVHGRVKELLEALAVTQADGTALVEPAPTHKAMAAQLGCGREMVTRVLQELQQGGHVAADRRSLRLLKKLPDKW